MQDKCLYNKDITNTCIFTKQGLFTVVYNKRDNTINASVLYNYSLIKQQSVKKSKGILLYNQ